MAFCGRIPLEIKNGRWWNNWIATFVKKLLLLLLKFPFAEAGSFLLLRWWIPLAETGADADAVLVDYVVGFVGCGWNGVIVPILLLVLFYVITRTGCRSRECETLVASFCVVNVTR